MSNDTSSKTAPVARMSGVDYGASINAGYGQGRVAPAAPEADIRSAALEESAVLADQCAAALRGAGDALGGIYLRNFAISVRELKEAK